MYFEFGCPLCPKTFLKHEFLMNHLNQPNGRCHCAFITQKIAQRMRYRHLPRGDEDAEETFMDVDDEMSTDEDTDDDENWTDEEDCMDDDCMNDIYRDLNVPPMDVDEPPPRTEVNATGHDSGPESDRVEFPGAAQTQDGDDAFMNRFHQDEHADKRTDNLYYPFASPDEWQMVQWMTSANLSVQETNRFLKLRMVRALPPTKKYIISAALQVKKMNLSFSTSKALRSRIETLPRGPQWKAKPWTSPFPLKRPLILYYRDPLELIESLLQNPLIQSHIHYSPVRLYTTAERVMRKYNEWLSGDVAWEMQASDGL
jgi:hypothetical protein